MWNQLDQGWFFNLENILFRNNERDISKWAEFPETFKVSNFNFILLSIIFNKPKDISRSLATNIFYNYTNQTVIYEPGTVYIKKLSAFLIF